MITAAATATILAAIHVECDPGERDWIDADNDIFPSAERKPSASSNAEVYEPAVMYRTSVEDKKLRTVRVEMLL